MATVTKGLLQNAVTTLLTTELNSLAAAAFCTLGTAIDNEPGVSNFDGYIEAELEFHLAAPSGAWAANSALNFWFIKSIDGGSTYEDGSTTTRPPDIAFPLRTDGSAQTTVVEAWLPIGFWKPMVQNSQGSSTQAFAATLNTVKVKPKTYEGV